MRYGALAGLCVALAGCQSSPEELTISFAGTCNRIGLMAGTEAFDKCMGGQWDGYYAQLGADQNRRAAQAALLLQSGAFATPPPPVTIYRPTPLPVPPPPINCTTTSGPNTGAFGVITSNTTCY